MFSYEIKQKSAIKKITNVAKSFMGNRVISKIFDFFPFNFFKMFLNGVRDKKKKLFSGYLIIAEAASFATAAVLGGTESCVNHQTKNEEKKHHNQKKNFLAFYSPKKVHDF
jgi:hypothetical protein